MSLRRAVMLLVCIVLGLLPVAAWAGPLYILAGARLVYDRDSNSPTHEQDYVTPTAAALDLAEKLIGGSPADYDLTARPRLTEYRGTHDEHWGISQAPVGYAVCAAWILSRNSGNYRFVGKLTTAPKSPDHIDGVHWYVDMHGSGPMVLDYAVLFVDASQKPANWMTVDDNNVAAMDYNYHLP